MAVAKTKAAVRQADKKNQKKKQKTSETERPEGESRHRGSGQSFTAMAWHV